MSAAIVFNLKFVVGIHINIYIPQHVHKLNYNHKCIYTKTHCLQAHVHTTHAQNTQHSSVHVTQPKQKHTALVCTCSTT